MSEERAELTGHLASQRRHVLGILEGLSEEQLLRPVLPSGWSCAGLVQHLTLDVERFWFQCVMAGEPEGGDGPDNAWDVPAGTSAATVLAAYRDETARSDEVIAARSLDASPQWWPDFFGGFRMDDLREVVLHVLTETAVHAGHLDVVRELHDRRQWRVLTD